MSLHYDLTVYSEVPVEREWLAFAHRYALRMSPGRRRFPRRVNEMLFFILLIKDHLKKPFHLVHAHSTYPTGFAAVLLQNLFGVPAIVSLHAAEASAFPDIPFGDLLHRRRRMVNRWVINRARIVTALTEFQRREVEANLGITREIIVSYRGVDGSRFSERASSVLQTPIVFLTVGYLNNIKDPDTLLRTFHLIQREVESILIVVGRDYTGGAVQALARELGISEKIRFEGWIDHEQIDRYYREAHFLLHTSRYESQGMVVAEALASGVVVAGTHVGLMSDLAGTCCITAPTQQPEALAREVLSLIKDPERMERMRQNARDWSGRHSLKECTGQICGLYERATGL